eukprot:g16653.t1
MVTMDERAPSFFQKLAVKAKKEPLVPIGALATLGFLVSGIYSFKQGNKHLSQKLMRGRVAAQGFTILVMTAGLYMAGPPQIQRETAESKFDAISKQNNRDQTCAIDDEGTCKKIDITCPALDDHQIDWDCVFGPESLEEVFQRGGDFTTCPTATRDRPCSRFIVKKEEERSEVKVQRGPEGFPFLYGEKYIFKYSFKAVEGMKVATRFTHLGQLKGSKGGKMIKGDPIYSLTANKHGLQVRFSNLESIEDFHPGMEEELDWDKATGEWVHVEIITTFGKSMEVNISGAVNGKAVWPSHLKPVAWHRDSEMVRMKLGLYHAPDKVHDGEVEYRDISIEGPNGIIRTSPVGTEPGITALGCATDTRNDRLLSSMYSNAETMSPELCAKYCEGEDFFGVQYGVECWCSGEKDADDDLFRHGMGNCDMRCPGNSNENCGGKWSLSLYHNGASLTRDAPEGSKYLGCFKDHQSDRALSHKNTSRSDMSYERCLDFCNDSKKSKYFAVQYGRECYCGEAHEQYDKHGREICDLPCSGDNSLVCGGFEASNVFSII